MNGRDVEGLRLFVDKLYIAIGKMIRQSGFDRTSVGQVIKVNGDGTYDVAAFSGAFTLPYKQTLKEGDVVRVKLPQNVWKDIYIESVE